MYITREKLLKTGIIAAIFILCVAIVALILNGINQFKTGSKLAGINQVSNLSHLLVRQQARLFSLMLVKNVNNDELVEALDTFAKEEFVVDASLYATNGILVAQSHNAIEFSPSRLNTGTESTQQIVEPILAQNDLVGFLRVTFNAQYGQTTQNKINALFHLLYGELIILFLAGGLFVSCFYLIRQPPVLANMVDKFSTQTSKTQTTRFHSRRRAFRRK